VALANLCQLSDAFKRGVAFSGTIRTIRKLPTRNLSSNTLEKKTYIPELAVPILNQSA